MKEIKDKLYFLKRWFNIVFLYPLENIDDVVEYDKYWSSRQVGEPGLNKWQERRVEIVAESRAGRDARTILDVGCGDGRILVALGRKLSGVKTIGIDISDSALSGASKRGIDVKKVDFTNPRSVKYLPGADLILLFEVLEHVSHSEVLLRATYKKANKGVFFSVPNSGYFLYRLRLLFGKFPMQWRVHPSEHVRFWTLADMYWWLEVLSYTNAKVLTYEGVPFLNKLWPSMFAGGIVVYLKK